MKFLTTFLLVIILYDYPEMDFGYAFLVGRRVRNFDLEISVAPINNQKIQIILWSKIVEFKMEKQSALTMKVQIPPNKISQISRSPPGIGPIWIVQFFPL